jgi:hypothetical protein
VSHSACLPLSSPHIHPAPDTIINIATFNRLHILNMPFVLYTPVVKTICVKMLLHGKSPTFINTVIGYNISDCSFAHWKALFIATCEVVCDPSQYLTRRRPLLLTSEQSDFFANIIHVDPTLYLDEIQASFQSQLSIEICPTTLYNELTLRLCLH